MGGPADSYNAAETIRQTCSDLVDHYADLAEAGADVLGKASSVIGHLMQWKVTTSRGGPVTVSYRDDKPSMWEVMWVGFGGTAMTYEEVEDPRRQQAYDALAEAQGIVEDVDEKFQLDSQDMRDSVTSVAENMAGWVDSVGQLSRLIFPSSASQVPTTGDAEGWRSPTAFGIYQENVRLQDNAHEETQRIIRAMLEREANFLQEMGDHLVTFANLAREQDQWYVDTAVGLIPGTKKFGDIMGVIDNIKNQVFSYMEQQTAEAEAMIGVLNGAVTATLKTEQLRGDVNALSEPAGDGGNGWPMPANVSGRTTDGQSNSDELRFQVQYFKDHIDFWGDLSEDFAPIVSTAEGTPSIEPLFLRFPAFSATATSGLNTLAGELKDHALKRGQQATGELSETLDLAIRNYLEGEALNTDIALELERMLDGD